MDGEVVKVVGMNGGSPLSGAAGIRSHMPGGMTTVSNVAGITGGIGPEGLAQRDIK